MFSGTVNVNFTLLTALGIAQHLFPCHSPASASTVTQLQMWKVSIMKATPLCL